MCLTAKNFGLQEENIIISKLQGRPLIRKTGWGTTERERDIWRERERKGGCSDIMKKEDNSLIDVENVETTG